MKIIKNIPLYGYSVDPEQLSFVDRLLIKSKNERPGFYQRMFYEDFARVFNFVNHGDTNLFQVETNDEELIRKMFGNLQARYRKYSVDETIRELVEAVAQSLIWQGTAYYFVQNVPEQEKIHITPLVSDNIFCFFSVYFQYVPKRCERYLERDHEMLPRELRILDKNKLMRFEIPRSLRRMLSEQNRTLKIIDKHQFGVTNFYPQATYENPNPKSHFDFSIWKNTQEQALFRATRKTGWNGRNYDSSKCSDFFHYYRLIRFRRNQLILRDYILLQLGKELTRVGHRYNEDFNVVISPTSVLPQIDKLDEMESLLSREEIDFTEVSDYYYER